MPYKVLNIYGEVQRVDKIDGSVHKHLSGREFTEEELRKFNPEEDVKGRIEKELEEEKPVTILELQEQYKEKLGKNPPNNMKNNAQWLKLKIDHELC